MNVLKDLDLEEKVTTTNIDMSCVMQKGVFEHMQTVFLQMNLLSFTV